MSNETLEIHNKIKNFWIERSKNFMNEENCEQTCCEDPKENSNLNSSKKSNYSHKFNDSIGSGDHSSNYDFEAINKNLDADFEFDGQKLKRKFLNFLEFTVSDKRDLDAKSQQQILTEKLYTNDHKCYAH